MTEPEKGTRKETGPKTGPETGPKIGPEIGLETGTGPETEPESRTGTGTGTGTGTETGPDQGSPNHRADSAVTRCGYVALIGAPNAGKSTLLNALVGAKVSIVTHKVQTTRAMVRGIMVHDHTQLILVDTPGIFSPKKRLERAMVKTAWSGARDADLVALLVDARRGLDDTLETLMQTLTEVRQPKVLILNKIDLVERADLLGLAAQINDLFAFDQTFMISALGGDGITALISHAASAMPPGPWLYPEDHLSDAPLRLLAAEITREKLFLRLHHELPYASTVETTSWKRQRNGSIRIEQTIYVERDSQKKIVIGKGGQAIKMISTAARKEIAEVTESAVHLFLFVKVREGWADDPERYREMGIDFSN